MSDEWNWPEGCLPRRNGVPVENQQEVLAALNKVAELEADLAEALEIVKSGSGPFTGDPDVVERWIERRDALLKRRGEG